MAFSYQGEQFLPDKDEYADKYYHTNSRIPPGENEWSESVPVDFHDTPDPNKGLNAFHHFYASNTCIPGPYRPRPMRTQTPMFNANGVHALFHSTQDLPYSTENGKAPPIPFPLENDSIAREFNVVGRGDGDPMKKEKCGCGGPMLPKF